MATGFLGGLWQPLLTVGPFICTFQSGTPKALLLSALRAPVTSTDVDLRCPAYLSVVHPSTVFSDCINVGILLVWPKALIRNPTPRSVRLAPTPGSPQAQVSGEKGRAASATLGFTYRGAPPMSPTKGKPDGDGEPRQQENFPFVGQNANNAPTACEATLPRFAEPPKPAQRTRALRKPMRMKV